MNPANDRSGITIGNRGTASPFPSAIRRRLRVKRRMAPAEKGTQASPRAGDIGQTSPGEEDTP